MPGNLTTLVTNARHLWFATDLLFNWLFRNMFIRRFGCLNRLHGWFTISVRFWSGVDRLSATCSAADPFVLPDLVIVIIRFGRVLKLTGFTAGLDVHCPIRL